MNSSPTLAFNKPYGVLSCFTDPEGRPTLAGFIPIPGVYAAGRLDIDSEGLLLLTSEGALAHRITDPEQKLPKVYWVQVERIPEPDSLQRLQEGVLLGGQGPALRKPSFWPNLPKCLRGQCRFVTGKPSLLPG